jgi:DNA-binding NarL/FixJ family response regulator
MIVEDDPLLGPLIARRLARDRAVIATTLAAAREILAKRGILAVVLDVWLGTECGLDLLAEMRAAGDVTPVLVLTGSDARDLPNRANSLDAEFVRKEEGFLGNVESFVLRANRGRPLNVEARADAFARAWELSRTQARVVEVGVRNPGYAAIAAELGMSQRTAEKHFQDIMKKTGDESREQVLVSALIGRFPDASSSFREPRERETRSQLKKPT